MIKIFELALCRKLGIKSIEPFVHDVFHLALYKKLVVTEPVVTGPPVVTAVTNV